MLLCFLGWLTFSFFFSSWVPLKCHFVQEANVRHAADGHPHVVSNGGKTAITNAASTFALSPSDKVKLQLKILVITQGDSSAGTCFKEGRLDAKWMVSGELSAAKCEVIFTQDSDFYSVFKNLMVSPGISKNVTQFSKIITYLWNILIPSYVFSSEHGGGWKFT